MAEFHHTPVTPQPPPDLPGMPEASPALVNYLRTFSLWAKNGLAGKRDTQTAAAGILLYANDAPAGTTPKVFSLQVKSDGTVVAVPVAIGSARRMA
jgi:hypothetical protein